MDIAQIESVVSKVMNVPIDLMHTKTRKREVVWARQLTYYYTKECGIRRSLSHIGSRYGQDHATVSHGRKNIAQLLENDSEIQKLVSEINIPLAICDMDFNAIPQL